MHNNSLLVDLETSLALAKQSIQNQQDHQIFYGNQNRKVGPRLRIGDLVLLEREGINLDVFKIDENISEL